MREVYLDNNATTAVLPEVFEAMRPFHTEHYGNPSSAHRLGSRPAAAVRQARKTMAGFLCCKPSELTFTSCGTESNNLALAGVLRAVGGKRHIITTAVEHPAVLNPLRQLEAFGHELTVLGVDRRGMIDVDELHETIRDDTVVVSVMYANNETGVIFPIDEIATVVHERGTLLHVDTVQAIGKVEVDLSTLDIDMAALSAHKFHGPKGVGALFLREGVACDPLLLGASQESGRRPGTENVAGVVAMATACELAAFHLDEYTTRVPALRDRLERALLEHVTDSFVNGGQSPRLPNTSNISFPSVDAHSMLVLLDEVGICASAGSACKSGAGVSSPVLAAMGLSPEETAGSVRFSLSFLTTDDDIDYALEQIPPIVARSRRR